jgi:hypothetical protein
MKSENRSFLRSCYLPFLVVGLLALAAGPVLAGSLDAKESEDLRQARQLYKSGNYQEAADIFSRLSSSHPDMPTFARNAGAAYYYLKKTNPALSNLREYLRVQKKLDAADREEVESWIAEMEKLRAKASTRATADPAADAPPGGNAPPPEAAAPGQAGGAGLVGAPTPSGASTSAMPPGYPPPGYYPYGVPPAQPQGAAGYAPGYPYPPAGAPTAPGATAPPAGQPYPPPYPYGYAPQQAAPPAAAIPPVQAGEVQGARTPEKTSGALPWIVGGAGVATLALGGVFTYLYQSAFSDTRAQYDPDRESAGKTYSYLQFVCYGLGAAGVTTAAILLLKSNHDTTGTTVSVAPTLGPRLAGADITVRY